MTTLQMEYFLALAERLSFTAVAERFFITQPTLSRQISNMEQELQTQLFIRDKTSVKLTPAGEELSIGLKGILQQYTALTHRVERIGNSIQGELRLGLSEEQLMSDAVSAALSDFHQRYPHVIVTIRRTNFKELRMGLLEGYLDVANVLYTTGGFLDHLEYTIIGEDSVCLAVGLPSAAGLSDSLTQEACMSLFQRHTLILASSDSFAAPTEDPMDGCRKLLGFQPPSIRFVGNLSSIPTYVVSNLGVTIANQTHVLRNDPNAVLLPLPYAKPYQKILAYRADLQNPLAEEFIALVRQKAAKKDCY
jgi:DNA-binding transcriptional LysR family regulator